MLHIIGLSEAMRTRAVRVTAEESLEAVRADVAPGTSATFPMEEVVPAVSQADSEPAQTHAPEIEELEVDETSSEEIAAHYFGNYPRTFHFGALPDYIPAILPREIRPEWDPETRTFLQSGKF